MQKLCLFVLVILFSLAPNAYATELHDQIWHDMDHVGDMRIGRHGQWALSISAPFKEGERVCMVKVDASSGNGSLVMVNEEGDLSAYFHFTGNRSATEGVTVEYKTDTDGLQKTEALLWGDDNGNVVILDPPVDGFFESLRGKKKLFVKIDDREFGYAMEGAGDVIDVLRDLDGWEMPHQELLGNVLAGCSAFAGLLAVFSLLAPDLAMFFARPSRRTRLWGFGFWFLTGAALRSVFALLYAPQFMPYYARIFLYGFILLAIIIAYKVMTDSKPEEG